MFKKIFISTVILLIIYNTIQYPLWGELHGPSYGFGALTICVYQLVDAVVEYYKKKGNKNE